MSKEGILHIKEKKGNKEAKFVLKEEKLNWEVKGKNAGTIELKKGYTALEKLSDTSFAIGPDNEGEYLELSGKKEDVEEWINVITPLIVEDKTDDDEFDNIDAVSKTQKKDGNKKTTNIFKKLFIKI